MDTRYHIDIDHDGDCWVVTFPQLPGCLVKAEDLHEAISAAEFTQEEYLGRWDEAARWAERWR